MMSLEISESMSPGTPPCTAPSTPKSRKSPGSIFRRNSTGKLSEPAPARRRLIVPEQLLLESESHGRRQESSGAEAAAREPVASRPTVTSPAISSAVDTIWSRGAGDEKYWSQVRHAHALLASSIGSELAMSEAVSRNESVLGPIFKDAIEAQEIDRLSAAEMLTVLHELMTRCDCETAAAVRARVTAAAAPLRKRSRHEDESDTEGEESDRESDEELLSSVTAVAVPSRLMPLPVSVALTAHSQTNAPALQVGTDFSEMPPCVPQHEVAEVQESSSASQTTSASVGSTSPITPLRSRRVSKGQLSGDEITPEAPQRRSGFVLVSAAQEDGCFRDVDQSASTRKKVRLLD